MIREAVAEGQTSGRGGAVARFFSIENRYLPPLFITLILLVGQVSFGVLESFSRTLLAIATSMAFELALSLLVYRKWPVLASAYITGISVGILIRSPEYWPYALTAAIASSVREKLSSTPNDTWPTSRISVMNSGGR